MPRFYAVPSERAARRRFYALMGAARKAPTQAQRVALFKRAEALRKGLDGAPVGRAGLGQVEGEAGMGEERSTKVETPRSASGRRKTPRSATN